MYNAYELKKITGPVLAPIILHRKSLVERLHEAIAGPAEGFPHHKLVLLYAPAGYGKTTLLADFARNTSLPCCWYLLDHSDTDKITFLQRLIAGIRQRFPDFGTVLDSLIASAITMEAGHHHHQAIADALIAAIAAENRERFVLFLCNYQEVNKCPEINELVNYLMHKLPTNCVLLIESRATPELEFATLLAHREMTGMGGQLLRFSPQEIRDLARLQGMAQLQETEAEQLVNAFEGWITGILLGSRLGEIQFLQQQNASHTSDNQRSHTDRQLLFSYVVNEVFQRHSDIYNFLKEASIFQEMVPSLCTQLLGISDAAERLQYLEQNGLFVTHQGEGDHITYTCHPVLRDLFYNNLRRESPERFCALHRRAAELLGASHNYEKAVYHALEASADEIAVRLILNSYEKMINQGHMQTLAHWIDKLPSHILAYSPRLLLLRTHIYLLVGDHINAFCLLDQVAKAIELHPASINFDEIPPLQIESNVLRSKALFQQGEYSQVQELCQQLLEHLPADEVKFRAEVCTRLGVCANLLGNYTVGVANLQKSLQLWGRHIINRETAEVHGALGSTYSLIGNFALAEYHITRSITCWEQLHDEWGKTNNLVRLGLIKQRQGALSEAENFFTQALIQSRGPINFLRGQAYALVNMGVLYQDLASYEKSLAVIEDGLALTRQLKDKYLTNYALCMLALTYLYMEDAPTALLLVSEVDINTNIQSTPNYEQAIRELAYGTILVYQHRYDEAYTCLYKIEASFNTMGLKREWLQAMLRLAVCSYEQKKTSDSLKYLEKIVAHLKMHNGYEHLILIELRRLHNLQRAIEVLPEMAVVREYFSLAPESQKPPLSFEQAQQPTPTIVSSLITQPSASTPKIAIQAFGEPLVTLQEHPITRWRMARSMELFFFLLDCGRPMRKEQIITALWSEVDDQINQTFHSTIYYLRKALEVPAVISQGSIYTLDLASHYGDNVCYDVALFQQQQARAKLALTQEDQVSLKDALLSMVELYRGDYVQAFYSDWCTFRRDELRHAYLDARRQLARIAWNDELFDESVVYWQHMLAIDDCLEDAHYGLMRCYVRQGKRGLALRQYQRCRDTLQRELALQPGTLMQNLYQRLMGNS